MDGLDEQEEAEACRAIIYRLLSSPNPGRADVDRVKKTVSKKLHLRRMPKNAAILAHATEEERKRLRPLLRVKSTRTLSGVTVVAVMTGPLPCPGKCVFCPGVESQPGAKVAKSYTGREPAAMRSIAHGYDPRRQVAARLRDLEAIGHVANKIELIVMGGTFLAAPADFRDQFVLGCYEGLLGRRFTDLTAAQGEAEVSERSLVGLTFETRPDYCAASHVDEMLRFGGTRVEIGAQTVYDDVYEAVCRGHDLAATKAAIKVAKDAGLKVNLHVMPNLPGSSLLRDEEMFQTLFDDPAFRPDMLKIYPTLVVEGTRLHELWARGEYRPYSLDEVVDLLARVKSRLPPYVRVQRVQRDIPADLIVAGVRRSDLRNLVKRRMEELGLRCGCIRCREQGFLARERRERPFDPHSAPLSVLEYEASGGVEYFLSYEFVPGGPLLGYLRLRLPSNSAHRPELVARCAIVREIRVVGVMVAPSEEPSAKQIQHRGLGSKLLAAAEELAFQELDLDKLLVISGVGVRRWFFNRGYERDGAYVSKSRS